MKPSFSCCNVIVALVQQYESGKRQIPLDLLIRLAYFYNTSIDYILEITDIAEPYPRSKS